MKRCRKIPLSLVLMAAPLWSVNTTIRDLPADTWYAAPNTKASAVMPTYGQFPGTWGVGGPSNVIAAWCGGIYDTKRDRLVIWGGGHADYYGNELYGFDVDSMKWRRLTDPFINPVMDQEVNADGTPNSRHTYGGLAYITHADRFFGLAGSLAGVGFATCNRTWTFDFDAKQWTNRNPAVTPTVGYDCYAAYDPESKRIWWQGGGSWGGLWSYDYDTNTWTKHNSDNFGSMANAVDTKRGLLFSIGNGGAATGGVAVYDIRNHNYTRQTWTTTGGDSFVSKVASGLAYDPVADRIVGWKGGAVYALNPDTKVWTVHSATGAPAATPAGIYGRWRYVPGVNAFITVTAASDNVYFYKLTAGAGTAGEIRIPASTGRPDISVTPNPVTGTAAIKLFPGNRNPGPLEADIIDVHGRVAASLSPDAAHTATWDSRKAPQGMYFIRLRTRAGMFVKEMMVIR